MPPDESASGFGQRRTLRRPDRIAVADDDTTNLTMIRLILGKWGYEAVACRDGEQAYQALSASDGPRLAILDWMMPGTDGVQLCRRLREEFPSRNYYLILLTSRSDDTDVLQALRSGADDFIAKPFSPTVLQARIEVGFRTLEMQRTIADFADQMQRLANSRATQLVHADRMASLGLISASIAHEINNPASFIAVNLATISGLWPSVAACLDGTPRPEDASRAKTLSVEMPSILREMEDGVARIRQITGELRAFSRNGPGNPGPVDIQESLRKTLRIASIRTKDRVDVSTDIEEHLPRVAADSTRLEQVFLNLVMNAVDAMEDRDFRKLSIRASKGEGMVEIRVADTGPGIPSAMAESLFQPFFTTKPSGKGTGLGLYISRGIVEEIGGVLVLESNDENGACFLVRLPIHGEELR